MTCGGKTIRKSRKRAASQLEQPRFICPHPLCGRSFVELWRLKVHFRAPPDNKGSGVERGHGVELDFCPRCGDKLQAGKYHFHCRAGLAAPRQALKRRERYEAGEIDDAVAGVGNPAVAPPEPKVHSSSKQHILLPLESVDNLALPAPDIPPPLETASSSSLQTLDSVLPVDAEMDADEEVVIPRSFDPLLEDAIPPAVPAAVHGTPLPQLDIAACEATFAKTLAPWTLLPGCVPPCARVHR